MSTNLNKTQQDYYDQVLEILGIDASQVQKGIILINATDGHGYLSSHDKYPTLANPFHVTIPDLETLQSLTGGADMQANQAKAASVRIPEPWSASNSEKSYETLNQQEEKNIRQALTAAALGYRDRVKSYDQIVQQCYFPLRTIAYAGETITIKRGQTLTIEPEGHDPVIVNFKVLTLEEGGQIKCEAPVILILQKFIKTPTSS